MQSLDELLERRRAHPADDLLSRIVTAELDGKPLSQGMARMYATTFIAGGIDTSKNMHSLIGYAFGRHVDARVQLREHPERLDNAVEEILRHYPVALVSCRTATRDLELGGRSIREGDFIMLAMTSANRDEAVWEEPDAFDITRSFDAAHQAFGWGPHLCPGANFARYQGRIALRELVQRFPDARFASDPRRRATLTLNGYSSVPLMLAP